MASSRSLICTDTSFSLANRYGRKPTLFAIWFILAMSILCESLARNWKVWVSETSYGDTWNRSLSLFVCKSARWEITGWCWRWGNP